MDAAGTVGRSLRGALCNCLDIAVLIKMQSMRIAGGHTILSFHNVKLFVVHRFTASSWTGIVTDCCDGAAPDTRSTAL